MSSTANFNPESIHHIMSNRISRRSRKITPIIIFLIVGVIFLIARQNNFFSTVNSSPVAGNGAPVSTSSPVASPAASSGSVPSSTGTIRSVHSPSIVVDDMHLSANQCHTRTLDAASGDFLPDPSCTPGGVDPAVTQSNIGSTICHSGYTKTVRAATSSTSKFKVASLSEYGLPYSHTTEYDHLISLELGGTNSVSNLWPEPNKTSATSFNNPKDHVENSLNAAVCSKKITLVQAQQAIATNWTTALQKFNLN